MHEYMELKNVKLYDKILGKEYIFITKQLNILVCLFQN